MISVLLPAIAKETCYPVTLTRKLESFPVANIPLKDFLSERLKGHGIEDRKTTDSDSLKLYIAADIWLSDECILRLSRASSPVVVRDSGGDFLAWVGKSPKPPKEASSLKSDDESFRIVFPWDLLKVNEIVVGETLKKGPLEKSAPGTIVDGSFRLGQGTRLLPGVCIEGDVIIGRNCTIGPNCYLRGNTSIGDNCKIGQAVEIKNSIILPGTNIGHLSYCGDSIVCENVNFGAGTITANFRHDGKNPHSIVNGKLINTGRRKLGTVVGDGAHTGIHTSIYPGRKLWPHTSTRPGDIVRYDIEPSKKGP